MLRESKDHLSLLIEAARLNVSSLFILTRSFAFLHALIVVLPAHLETRVDNGAELGANVQR